MLFIYFLYKYILSIRWPILKKRAVNNENNENNVKNVNDNNNKLARRLNFNDMFFTGISYMIEDVFLPLCPSLLNMVRTRTDWLSLSVVLLVL